MAIGPEQALTHLYAVLQTLCSYMGCFGKMDAAQTAAQMKV